MEATTPTTLRAQEPLPWWERLPGGLVIWIIVGVELATFAMFFLSYAYSAGADASGYAQARSLLHPGLATINTGVLLTGSLFAARSCVRGALKDSKPWLYATGAAGVVFTAIKLYEYNLIFGLGIGLSTHTAWFFYLFLTMMHLVHVIIGIFISVGLAMSLTRQTPPDREPYDAGTVEAVAIYWHLVDLIWLVLFALIYMGGGSQ